MADRATPRRPVGRRARRRARPRRPRCAPSAATPASITAVVSVADDGGSSGRLRRDLGVPPPGDLRRCLVALAGDDGVWSDAFEHRFARRRARRATRSATSCSSGSPRRSATSPPRSTRPVACCAPSAGCCPATTEPVVLKADVERRARSRARWRCRTAGRIRRVELVPADAPRTPRRGRRRSPPPTRSCSRPDRSTRACCRCSACPSSRAAVAATPAPGRPGRQPAARRSPRPPASTPPTTCAAVARPRRPGRPVPLPARRRRSPVDDDRIRALGRRAGRGRRRPGRRARPRSRNSWRQALQALL